MLLWPEVIFFPSALCASLTRLRREISIRKEYPLEPRVFTMYYPWKKPRKEHSTTIAPCRHLLRKTWRVVGFDQATHNQCQLYEKTGNPIKLLQDREENGHYLVNQTTTLCQMSNSDVTFNSTLPSSSSHCGAESSPVVASTNISLNQLPTLTRNQKVNVTGVLTLGQKPPKQVTKRMVKMERSKKIVLLKMPLEMQSSTYGMNW